jgi:hypothetical protein
MKVLRNKFKEAWNSPTLNTMFSFVSKPLSFIVVLPLILNRFTAEEIALWYLFGLIASFQSIADFGFDNTFVRVISYAMGGAKDIREYDKENTERIVNDSPNKELLKSIVGVMSIVYKWLFLVIFMLLIATTYFIQDNILKLNDPMEGWVGWWIIISVTSLNFYGRKYSNFLFGLNKVALVRRVEGFYSLMGIFASFIVLILDGSFMMLVIVNQVWMLNNIIRNWYLARSVNEGLYKSVKSNKFNSSIFWKIWKPSWRGGVSSLCSQGVVIFSGILYSSYALNSSLLAEYLLTLKFYSVIKGFSQAPFYSKIPNLAKLRSQGRIDEWMQKAKRGMTIGNYLMVFGIVGFGFFGKYFFELIQSSVTFPQPKLWGLMGLAYFLHRYGAMHTQLYMTTNKVNNHISDTIAGLIFIVSSVIMFPYLDVYSFPLGMILGYGLFYCEYAAYYSYKNITISFWKFELLPSLIPFAGIVFYLMYLIF